MPPPQYKNFPEKQYGNSYMHVTLQNTSVFYATASNVHASPRLSVKCGPAGMWAASVAKSEMC